MGSRLFALARLEPCAAGLQQASQLCNLRHLMVDVAADDRGQLEPQVAELGVRIRQMVELGRDATVAQLVEAAPLAHFEPMLGPVARAVVPALAQVLGSRSRG